MFINILNSAFYSNLPKLYHLETTSPPTSPHSKWPQDLSSILPTPYSTEFFNHLLYSFTRFLCKLYLSNTDLIFLPQNMLPCQHFPKWWHHHSHSCQVKIPTSLLPFLKKLYFTCYYYCQTDWTLSKLAFSCVPHFEGIIQGHSLYAGNYSDSSFSVCSQSFCLITSFFLFCCATSTCNNACILLMLT